LSNGVLRGAVDHGHSRSLLNQALTHVVTLHGRVR
jgi:hypothetical protein